MPFFCWESSPESRPTDFRSALLEMLDEGFKSSSQVGGFPSNGDGRPLHVMPWGLEFGCEFVLVDNLWRYLGEIIL